MASVPALQSFRFIHPSENVRHRPTGAAQDRGNFSFSAIQN
jgi:hypothetical protein